MTFLYKICLVLLFTISTLISHAQLMCDITLVLTENVNDPCLYDLVVTANNDCSGYEWTDFTINSNTTDPAEIKSAIAVDPAASLTLSGTPTTQVFITNTGITGAFILGAGVSHTIATFEFENGESASDINLTINGTNPDGNAAIFTEVSMVDANCIAANPCFCNLDLVQDPNFNCCYSIIAEQIGSQCFGGTFGNIVISTINGGSQTSAMYNEQGFIGNTAVPTGTSMLSIIPPAAGWGFLPGVSRLTVGQVCFQNGTNSENVNLAWQGTSGAGTPISCAKAVNIDASCPPAIDCSCFLSYNQVDDCCYEVGVEFRGADCPNLSFTDIKIDSNNQPARACQIYQATPIAPGISVSPITAGSTEVTFSSGAVNLGNITNVVQVIGEICLSNGTPPICNVDIVLTENSSASPGCDITMEAQTCPPPKPFDKLVGDSLANTPIKVIPVGNSKMQVLGNSPQNGINYGTLIQYDLGTQRIDWIQRSEPGHFYLDVAYHPGVALSYVVGFTTSNTSLITTVDPTGQCSDIKTYDLTGFDAFRKIIYNPSSTRANHDLYIVGSKNATAGSPTSEDQTVLINIRTNCIPNWNREIVAGPTDDEFYQGIFPRAVGDGVFIVGDHGSAASKAVWIEFDDTGNIGGQFRTQEDINIWDGHQFANGDKVLIGKDAVTNDKGVISLWDSNNNFIDAIEIKGLLGLRELVYDGSHFYSVSKDANVVSKNVIVKFHIDASNRIVVDDYFENENGETDFRVGTINWHPVAQFILYADGRKPVPQLALGNFDTYMAAYDQLFSSSECLDEITFQPDPINLSGGDPNYTLLGPTFPNAQGGMSCSQIMYACEDYCQEIICDPGWEYAQKGCYEIQFTDTSNVIQPATYMWDINNDGTVDTLDASFCYDFGCAGTFDVCLKVTDASGIEKTVCKTITVNPDSTPPICTGIMAPVDTTVMACERGAVRSWIPPTFMDDCSQVTVTSTHNPGDFFECGRTIVSYTGTNKDGLSTTCSFPVQVNCTCAVTDSTSISCGTQPDQFAFYFRLNDLTGATSCTTATVTLPGLGNVNLSLNQWNSTTRQLEVAGTIDATAYPFPTSFNLRVDYSCICSDGLPYDCVHYVPFITPCCDSAYIDPAGICKVEDEEYIDIRFYGTVRDIDKVDYFIQPAPCPTTRWGGIPYQTSVGYQPLRILPPSHSQDVCIYARVVLGDDEEPCDTLYTNIVTLTLCSPYDCSLNDQEHCYTGTAIVPQPITYGGALPDCEFKIDWYDPQGNIIPLPPITTTIQPPALHFRGAPEDCYEDYIYEMQLIGECDTVSCTSRIRLWNEDAPEGAIELDPIENLPLCYGGDATLVYQDSCIDPSGTWTWLESSDGISYSPSVGTGNMNPSINSNRLYNDKWFGVSKQNGTCPEDTTFFYVPVKADLIISSFDADPLDPCRETGVKLSVQYSPCLPSINGICNCNYTINWYKNGLLIGTTNSNQPNASFTYIDSALNGNYSGVYYAEVIDNCCDNIKRSSVDIVDPPIGLCIIGPCYICEAGTQFTLMGSVKNGPAIGNNCTYQWNIFNTTTSTFQAIAGAIQLSYTTTKPGLYKLEMTCINGNTSCFKEVEFEVKDCTPGATSIFDYDKANFDFIISPNPTDSDIKVEIIGNIYELMTVELYNITGQKLSSHLIPLGDRTLTLGELIPGVYLIRMVSNNNGALTKQLVVQ